MISVCIATFNGEHYIQEQLDSILHQLTEGDEIIISDDSSTDRTVEIIKGYQSTYITLLENQTFKSPTFNFENALQYAKNEMIFLSDQDDIWENNKVEIMMKHLQTYDLVLSDASIVNEKGQQLEPSFFNLNHSKSGLVRNLMKNSYIGCTMAFNRNILTHALPFPKNIPMHDWWIGVVAELFGNIYFHKEPLTRYRRHHANVSASADQSPYSFYIKIRMRYIMSLNLIKRWLR